MKYPGYGRITQAWGHLYYPEFLETRVDGRNRSSYIPLKGGTKERDQLAPETA